MSNIEIIESKPAPDFELTDSHGNKVKLSDYKGNKIVLLVFNRGFVWPYCRKHMAQLRSDYHEFVKRGAEIIAIGPEREKAFAEWWHKHEMPFIGLADPEHSVSALYGQEVKILKLGRMPAQLIIDKNGLIRYKHYGKSMSDIAENKEILSKIDELNRE